MTLSIAIAILCIQATADPVPTYATAVAPIVAQACTECHRGGGIAPFSLESAADLTNRAAMVARVVGDGTMPPWFATADAVAAHRFRNDRSLSDADKSTLLAWLQSESRPIGDLSKAPPPRGAAPEWRVGKPDVVLEFPHGV